ncbi:transposase, partial [Nitrosovibrio sp. Nv17]|uniref:transposase n=1 Tax=Nitrosovibrio sp. Nv17 TaxID=1855339 RepID=UPI00090912AE
QDQITAPMVLDGPMNGAAFLAYVRTFLCPTLRPGDMVVANNLSCHKVDGVKQAIEAVGATLRYLPPYSPDLNPIEKMFSKLKALLRKSAARTVEALWNEIGRLLDAFTPQECSNYLASSGLRIAANAASELPWILRRLRHVPFMDTISANPNLLYCL